MINLELCFPSNNFLIILNIIKVPNGITRDTIFDKVI